jgi:exodeoxyribonuclease V gamma subunit
VVSELQDYINQSWIVPEGSVCDQLTTCHPMQPFSRRCFDGTAATAGYNPAWLPADRETAPRLFHAAALPPPGPEWRSVEIQQMVRFWRHPVRFFLQQIVGLQLRLEEAGIEENEPFALTHLQQYQLRQQTVDGLLGDLSPDQVYRNLRSSGSLPQGGFGQHQFAGIATSGCHFADLLRPLLTAPLPPLEVDRRLGAFHLTGWLTNLYDNGRITWRSAALKGSTLMELWIHHLVLNLLAPANLPLRSVHAARAPSSSHDPIALSTFKPVADPERYLQELLDWYWQGLARPLHFFPETSRARAEAAGTGKEDGKALFVWEGDFHRHGEGEDPAYGSLFKETNPLDSEFVALSTLFTPIFAHLEGDHAAA